MQTLDNIVHIIMSVHIVILCGLLDGFLIHWLLR